MAILEEQGAIETTQSIEVGETCALYDVNGLTNRRFTSFIGKLQKLSGLN